jgi:tyrosinase
LKAIRANTNIAIMEVFHTFKLLTAVDTFPTWHRPYVALYEQFVATHFATVIQDYSEPLFTSLTNSAKVWRLPYWEWAANPSIPPEWRNAMINIWGTDGSVVPVDNPFLGYTFHPSVDPSFQDVSPEIATWPSTLRQPDQDNINAQSDPDAVDIALQGSQLKTNVAALFTEPSSAVWSNFSNQGWVPGSIGPMNSLEGIHGSVHNAVGGLNFGGGHMSNIPVAAFDPIFWMHHNQVERLFALWQAINYTTKVPDDPNDFGIPQR